MDEEEKEVADKTTFWSAVIPPMVWRVPTGKVDPSDPNGMTHREWAAKWMSPLANNSTLIVPETESGSTTITKSTELLPDGSVKVTTVEICTPPGVRPPEGPYSRFSDRARKVMQLANQEATRLADGQVDLKHLLCGLLTVGSGVGYLAIQNLSGGMWYDNGSEIVMGPQEPVAGGERLPHSPAVRKVVEDAIAAATDLRHSHIGTEHLLLGLLGLNDLPAHGIVLHPKVTFDNARLEIIRILKPNRESEADTPQVIE